MTLLTIEQPLEPALGLVRHDWKREEVRALFALPFPELIYQAQCVHRAHFNPTEVQISTLLSIKTGGCPEDCAYCPQSAKYETGVINQSTAMDQLLRLIRDVPGVWGNLKKQAEAKNRLAQRVRRQAKTKKAA